MGTRVSLDMDVQFLRGVGPVRAAEFVRLGVRNVGDLIQYFPFRHDKSPKSVAIDELEEDKVATIVGTLSRIRKQGRHSRMSVSAEVEDGTGRCRVRWFNTPHLIDQLDRGQVVRLTGKVAVDRELALLTNPTVTIFDDADDPLENDDDRFGPVYSGTALLPTQRIAKLIHSVLDEGVALVEELLPDAMRTRHEFPPLRTAIQRYHCPTDSDDVEVARKRLAFDEFLLCQLAVQMSRRRRSNGPASRPILTSKTVDERIRKRFPFELTSGQNVAIAEIREDLARKVAMNRMLQADVGAGKTAVAVYAALAAIASRRQVVFLAPTEVLASQHRAKIHEYLNDSRVRIGYLVGGIPRGRRAEILKELATRKLDIIIGTHALLEPGVRFADLGLVVIDEQHKFGVAQRAKLRTKGNAPHTLVLTATPIPRTLAMTVFGDLDVSTIQGVLPGRQPIVTRVVSSNDVDKAWGFVRTRLERGEQVFVVYPLVDESEAMPLKAATVEAEKLGASTLAGHTVGLLHGKMSADEKAEAMRRFRDGDIRVLVSTTVIEVGVDVPSATVMVIQHAERYGLSQLHQLRGRIGRGSVKSFCLLMTDSAAESAAKRLAILCETNDGFRIAEEDLRLRGPGELLGTRQHGLPAFRVADVVNDFALLEAARDEAATLLRSDPKLLQRAHAPLRRALNSAYGKSMKLIDVA